MMDAEVIRRLNAGPVLDEAVAQALGWTYEPRFAGDAEGYWISPTGTRYIYEERPRFSSDLNAVDDIAAWLADKGYEPSLTWHPTGAITCMIDHPEALLAPTYQAEAETAPVAFCRSLLLWARERKAYL